MSDNNYCMAHIPFIAEGYPEDLDVMEHRIKNKCYILQNPVDDELTTVQPALREFRFYDLVIQKQLIPEALHDLGVPRTWNKYLCWLQRAWNLLLSLAPTSFKPVNIPKQRKILGQPYKGLMPRIKVIPLAMKEDYTHKDNYEEV